MGVEMPMVSYTSDSEKIIRFMSETKGGEIEEAILGLLLIITGGGRQSEYR